jgi:hypothetical protein
MSRYLTPPKRGATFESGEVSRDHRDLPDFDRDPNTYGIRALESCRARTEHLF